MRAVALGLCLAAALPAAAADYQPGAPLETYAGARALDDLSLLEPSGDRQGVMRAAALGLCLAAALPAAAADYQPGAPLETYAGARADFAFRCKGCHGFGGEGTPGHVPRLDGFVGFFTQVEGGREYLMRVPGVARAKLDDERLAGVLNWMLEVYGGDAVAPDFAPYTAAEVSVARREPLTATLAPTRARLIRELHARGLIAPDADAGLPLAEAAKASADQADRQIAEP